ncbi:MAG: large conductance mechanosensitive channel protein MscL [Chthoniobacter sp.]|uniref:large conductance mechanosensitive channel protein MscL n=1 Tax=Chthoniobacter sp. TaxID=2510640 RepID=UPI0032ADB96D
MNIKEIAKEFEAFILKGNVVDLAVGVVIGAAFKSVVDALVGGLINPLLVAMHLLAAPATPVGAADVLKSIVSFVAIAAVVFFFVVKPMNFLIAKATRKAEEKPAEPTPLPQDVQLLMEIRDLLKTQPQHARPAGGTGLV